MPIAFDTSHPVDTEERRIALVRAIVAAGDRDGERHWIEWKREVEIASQEAESTLAQEILAMANRDRARALTHCGGWGYIVVGASEEGIVGVKRQKTAIWEQQLGGYLGEGGDAPRWEPVTVTVDDKDVLIFCVEPPLDGDPIFALRAKNGNAEPGTVYARTIEKAQRANADQLRMLQQRLLAGSFDNRLTERLTIACATLDATLVCRPKMRAMTWTACVTPRTWDGEYPPEVVVLGVANGSLSSTFPSPGELTPLPGSALIVVFPQGSDLGAAMEEVDLRLRKSLKPVAIETDPMAPGAPVVVCSEGFSELHNAVQWLLTAGTEGVLPMTFGLHVRKLVRQQYGP